MSDEKYSIDEIQKMLSSNKKIVKEEKTKSNEKKYGKKEFDEFKYLCATEALSYLNKSFLVCLIGGGALLLSLCLIFIIPFISGIANILGIVILVFFGKGIFEQKKYLEGKYKNNNQRKYIRNPFE